MKKWIGIILICVIILSNRTTLTVAQPLYFQGFDDTIALNNFDLNIPENASIEISDENVLSGEGSLHLVSTADSDWTFIKISLNIPFSDLQVSLDHYFVEGYPLYNIQLVGSTEISTNTPFKIEFGRTFDEENGETNYRWEQHGAQVDQYDPSMSQWISFTIDVGETITQLFSIDGKPWDYFEPTTMVGFEIGLNPLWGFSQRNVFVDNLMINSLGTSNDGQNDLVSHPPDISKSTPSNRGLMLKILQYGVMGLGFVALGLMIVNTVYDISKGHVRERSEF